MLSPTTIEFARTFSHAVTTRPLFDTLLRMKRARIARERRFAAHTEIDTRRAA